MAYQNLKTRIENLIRIKATITVLVEQHFVNVVSFVLHVSCDVGFCAVTLHEIRKGS